MFAQPAVAARLLEDDKFSWRAAMIKYNNREFKSSFDVQMYILFRVLGATHHANHLTNHHIASILKVDEAQVSRRRSGRAALREGDASAIIYGYNLNDYGLDFHLFDIEDPDAFLAELKRHGVGVYQSSPRRLLSKELESRAAVDGLSIEIRRRAGDRGIVYGPPARFAMQTFRPGFQVELLIRGAVGRHIAVVQTPAGVDHRVETLAPTSILPLTELVDPTLVLPNFGETPLLIARPSGKYRLYAVEADQALVELFAGDDLEERESETTAKKARVEAVALSDAHAAAILAALEARQAEDVRVASVDFIVE